MKSNWKKKLDNISKMLPRHNGRLKIYLFLLSFFTYSVSFSQSAEEFTKRYNQGKELFNKGKLDLAKETLSPLIAPNSNNFYVEYAYYYCGVIDFYKKNFDDAQLFLTNLLEKYPTWNKKDEVNYILANIAFEKKDELGGMNYLKNIQNTLFNEDVKNIKRFYLDKREVSILKALRKQFPDDAMLAEILYFQLKKVNSSDKDDQQLIKQLNKQYNFGDKQPEPEPNIISPLKNGILDKIAKKEVYNIAVLFPFSIDNLDPNKSLRGNQLVLDMYEGISIAKEELEKKDIKLKITAYDIGKDGNVMLETVNQSGFDETDLIIGPLYPATNQVAVAFANEKTIALLNPISSNSKLIENNPSAFLLKPSLETRAKQAAAFAFKNFSTEPVIIFYGTTEEDSTYAFTYQKIIAEKGIKVQAFKKIGTAEIAQFGLTLNGKNEKNMSHIFIASTNSKVVSSFMNTLENISSKIPVLTASDWFRFDMVNFERFEQRNVHFVYPEYIDYQREPVRNFKQSYLKKTNIIPSIYAYQGYDMIMFFGKMLYENGTHFHQALHEHTGMKGWIFSGFDYRNSNDNQYVPVFKFENSDFVLLNPIEE